MNRATTNHPTKNYANRFFPIAVALLGLSCTESNGASGEAESATSTDATDSTAASSGVPDSTAAGSTGTAGTGASTTGAAQTDVGTSGTGAATSGGAAGMAGSTPSEGNPGAGGQTGSPGDDIPGAGGQSGSPDDATTGAGGRGGSPNEGTTDEGAPGAGGQLGDPDAGLPDDGSSAGGEGGANSGGADDAGGTPTLECDTSWDDYPSKGDGVALTPPMGWNSWNAFHENINEQQIREVADVMVSSGLRDAGYIYLNLDDKWMDDDGRDGSGRLVGDSERFPSGMAALADYVHGLGLKFGLYGDRGTDTCAHYNANTPSESGSYGRETLDAETFASWGVDYLKYDNCAIAPGRDNDQAQEEDYRAMSDALKATGRPIVFSICAWDAKPWMPEVGHLWRSTFDIGLCFSGCDEWYRNIDEIIDENNETVDWAGPGHWNDPDMMVVGNGLPYNEDVAHFSMWALMAAPIILGNDIRTMSDQTHGILTNEEVIAVNQDPAGVQGSRVTDNGDLEVWMKPLCTLDGPEKAVVLLNRSGSSAEISVSLSNIGITGSATVRDLWAHEDLGVFQNEFSAEVPSHGVVMLKIVEVED